MKKNNFSKISQIMAIFGDIEGKFPIFLCRFCRSGFAAGNAGAGGMYNYKTLITIFFTP